MQSTLDRFMSKVKVDDSTGCWEWQRGKCKDGYGFFYANKRQQKAHRVSYQIFVQPIGDGMFICHTCDNPGCVNPCHLFQGTPKDNTQDMVNKKRFDRKGSKNPRAKLSNEEAAIAAEFLKRFPPTKKSNSVAFGSVTFLANWFGVYKTAISEIGRRKSWTHIN